jgi:hypothetical protein
MKKYSRVLAGIAMAALVLTAMPSAICAAQATDSSTAAKTKRKSKKAKTADNASTAAPAAPATAPAPAPKATSKTPAPVANASASDIAAAKASGKVWVNTDTGIYHKGGRWYGKTKQGKFMSEDEAKKAGFHAAKAEIGVKKT